MFVSASCSTRCSAIRCESVSVSIGPIDLQADLGVVELLEARDLVGDELDEARVAGSIGLVARELTQGGFDRRELLADAVDLQAESLGVDRSGADVAAQTLEREADRDEILHRAVVQVEREAAQPALRRRGHRLQPAEAVVRVWLRHPH